MTPHTDLTHAVHALTDTDAPITGIHPLTGGTKKTVLRLRLGNQPLIAYLWHPDHFNSTTHDPTDPLAPASSAHLFAAAHTQLNQLGLPVPALHALDTSRTHHRAHIALLQDLGPTNLQHLLHHRPHTTGPVLQHLRNQLHTLHTHTHPRFGRPTQLTQHTPPPHPTCEQMVLTRALTHLDQAADLAPRLRPHRKRLHQLLHTRAGAVRPRTRHGLIHGELGPEHVIVTDQGIPHLIDIEGLMFFDTEWEHAYLRMRLGPHHPRLTTVAQDPARTALYTLALHLSLVAGPLQLLARPHCPEPEQMRAIAQTHLAHTLATH